MGEKIGNRKIECVCVCRPPTADRYSSQVNKLVWLPVMVIHFNGLHKPKSKYLYTYRDKAIAAWAMRPCGLATIKHIHVERPYRQSIQEEWSRQITEANITLLGHSKVERSAPNRTHNVGHWYGYVLLQETELRIDRLSSGIPFMGQPHS